ncbi:uncharacterized protein F4812DRAFT_458057 [Daldinia caldariorum]|uniref:uncharacterized protein n=1 Tax=Daldinia caldariorum TaxID=326644 RepID=UPI002008C584|nr:uncharacterized protein F4812DRAFT_458057 [Daldinia caldariorum]KAI1469521.1 hypothetical protein F4812DRAFT_458057 [Daldinia caldariorum]
MIGVMTMMIVLCTAFTLARMCTRYFINQHLWWDDWAMFFAWMGTICLCALQLLMMKHGGGVNIWDVPNDELKRFLELFLDVQMVARVSIFFARLSILLLYIRIFFPIGAGRSAFWWVIQIVIWLNLLYTIALILVTTLQCVPYHLSWGHSCVNQWLVLVMASTINIITDIAVLIIPIASISKLHTARKRKWAIWALFAFGALAPLVSIARLAYQIPEGNGENRTVIYPIVLIMATAEQAVAMIVGSAPVASTSVVRLLWRRKPIPAHNRGISQRIWPGRERTDQLERKSPRGVPDPFHITVATWENSTDVLYSGNTTRQRDGNSESIEMEPRTPPDIKRATPRRVSLEAVV